MKTILLLLLLSSPLWAQTCPCPQAELFASFEPDTHEGPGRPFRALLSQTAATCAPEDLITSLVDPVSQGGVLMTVSDTRLGLLYALRFRLLFASVATVADPTTPIGQCFRVDVKGFKAPAGPFSFPDACGQNTVTIGQPRYACTIGNGTLLVCYAAKNVGTPAPLPAGYDRMEDVCTTVDVL